MRRSKRFGAWGSCLFALFSACTAPEIDGHVVVPKPPLDPDRRREPPAAAIATEEVLVASTEQDLFPSASEGELLFQEERWATEPGVEPVLLQVIARLPLAPRGPVEVLSNPERFSTHPVRVPGRDGLLFITNALGPRALVYRSSFKPEATLTPIIASDRAKALADVAVSPDGQRVAFSYETEAGARHVAALGIDGTGWEDLGEGRAPAWSPDRAHLVVARTVADHTQLISIDLASRAEVALTDGPFNHDRPAFSPDGARLALVSNRGQDRPTRTAIFILDLPRRALMQVSPEGVRATTPTFAPDGTLIYARMGATYDLVRAIPSKAPSVR